MVLFCAVTLLFLWSSPDQVLEAMQQQDPTLTEQRLAEQGLSVRAIQVASTVLVALAMAWSVVASAVAGLALAGRSWARIALLASAVVASAVCLLGSLASAVMLAPMVGCLVVVVLLMRPEVRGWR